MASDINGTPAPIFDPQRLTAAMEARGRRRPGDYHALNVTYLSGHNPTAPKPTSRQESLWLSRGMTCNTPS